MARTWQEFAEDQRAKGRNGHQKIDVEFMVDSQRIEATERYRLHRDQHGQDVNEICNFRWRQLAYVQRDGSQQNRAAGDCQAAVRASAQVIPKAQRASAFDLVACVCLCSAVLADRLANRLDPIFQAKKVDIAYQVQCISEIIYTRGADTFQVDQCAFNFMRATRAIHTTYFELFRFHAPASLLI